VPTRGRATLRGVARAGGGICAGFGSGIIFGGIGVCVMLHGRAGPHGRQPPGQVAGCI
jgi:hypothetical protein